MERTAKSQQELLQWLNSELAKQHMCTGCLFTSIAAVDEPDANGCNWSSASFQCRLKGTPAAVCTPKANQTIALARTLFNVAA